MIETLIQFGALGIVAYVVYFQMNITNKAIRNNTVALNKLSYYFERYKK